MYTYDSSHTDMKLQVVTAEIMKKCIKVLFFLAWLSCESISITLTLFDLNGTELGITGSNCVYQLLGARNDCCEKGLLWKNKTILTSDRREMIFFKVVKFVKLLWQSSHASSDSTPVDNICVFIGLITHNDYQLASKCLSAAYMFSEMTWMSVARLTRRGRKAKTQSWCRFKNARKRNRRDGDSCAFICETITYSHFTWCSGNCIIEFIFKGAICKKFTVISPRTSI